jgi:hypothetical protein
MDSVAKHTAGPWMMDEHDKLNSARAYGIVRDIGPETDEPDSPRMTEVIAEVCDGPTAEADARLIAAAPAMAEALERIVAWIAAGCDPSRKSLEAACAALELAGVRTPAPVAAVPQ